MECIVLCGKETDSQGIEIRTSFGQSKALYFSSDEESDRSEYQLLWVSVGQLQVEFDRH
jgi:hypothetical protein